MLDQSFGATADDRDRHTRCATQPRQWGGAGYCPGSATFPRRAIPRASQIAWTATGTGNFRSFTVGVPLKRHGVIRIVNSRGRHMINLPTWSDLGHGSASLIHWPHVV